MQNINEKTENLESLKNSKNSMLVEIDTLYESKKNKENEASLFITDFLNPSLGQYSATVSFDYYSYRSSQKHAFIMVSISKNGSFMREICKINFPVIQIEDEFVVEENYEFFNLKYGNKEEKEAFEQKLVIINQTVLLIKHVQENSVFFIELCKEIKNLYNNINNLEKIINNLVVQIEEIENNALSIGIEKILANSTDSYIIDILDNEDNYNGRNDLHFASYRKNRTHYTFSNNKVFLVNTGSKKQLYLNEKFISRKNLITKFREALFIDNQLITNTNDIPLPKIDMDRLGEFSMAIPTIYEHLKRYIVAISF